MFLISLIWWRKPGSSTGKPRAPYCIPLPSASLPTNLALHPPSQSLNIHYIALKVDPKWTFPKGNISLESTHGCGLFRLLYIPPGHLPLGHLPPRTHTPWTDTPWANRTSTDIWNWSWNKKLLFTLLYLIFFKSHLFPLFFLDHNDNYEENTKQKWKERTWFYSKCNGQ